MSNPNKMLCLPNIMATWPWHRRINPHYEAVKAESNAWFHSFKAFSVQSQYAFDKCDFALLAALVYPRASKEHLRTGCDLMNLLFAIDEYTDVEPEPVVRSMVDIVIDAFKHPYKPRPEGEIVLGEIARQFWELAIKTASPTSQRHMIEGLIGNLDAVVQQAADRDNDTYLSTASYIEFRRENIGARPAYVPMELGLNLPDEVFYHPIIIELSVHIADMVILNNDITSYNKEQATGDDRHNILTLAMHEFKIDLEGAMDWVLNYHRELETKFREGLKRVPSWGPDMDRQVQQYVDGLANWPRGNDCWCFESGRYFGNKGREIQKTRRVPLLRKVVPPSQDMSLRRENVVVPLIEALESRA